MQTGIKRLGNILPTSTRENPNQGRVYDTGGIAPAITSGGGTVPCIITETEAEPWLKESLLQAEGETKQSIGQNHRRTYGAAVRTELRGVVQHTYFRPKRQLCFGNKDGG